MTKYKELLKNTIIIASGKIVTQFLSFLLLPLYTAYLATSEFGAIDLVMTYAVLLAPLITVQLEMAVFRFLIDSRDAMNDKRMVISSAFRIALISILVFALAAFILNRFIAIPYLLLLIMTIISIIISNLLLQVARGLGDNIKYSIAIVVTGVVAIAANVILIVLLGTGAKGILMAVIFGNIANICYLSISLKIYRYINLSKRHISLEREILRYSAPLVPNGISWWLINAADRTIITIVLGAASNGVYAVAYKFPVVFSSLFSFFSMSWTESAALNINNNDRDDFFSETLNASLRLFGSLGLCIIAAVSVAFDLLVNDAYSNAYLYIPLLILGSFFNAAVSMYGSIYIAKKMTKQVMNSSLIAAFVSIVLTISLIPWIKLFAPALAMIAGYGAMAVYRHFDVKKYVRIKYDYKSITILAVAFIAVTSIYYANIPALNILNLIIAIGISFVLNKSIIKILKIKLITRLRPLTPDKQVMEKIEYTKNEHN